MAVNLCCLRGFLKNVAPRYFGIYERLVDGTEVIAVSGPPAYPPADLKATQKYSLIFRAAEFKLFCTIEPFT